MKDSLIDFWVGWLFTFLTVVVIYFFIRKAKKKWWLYLIADFHSIYHFHVLYPASCD